MCCLVASVYGYAKLSPVSRVLIASTSFVANSVNAVGHTLPRRPSDTLLHYKYDQATNHAPALIVLGDLNLMFWFMKVR